MRSKNVLSFISTGLRLKKLRNLDRGSLRLFMIAPKSIDEKDSNSLTSSGIKILKKLMKTSHRTTRVINAATDLGILIFRK
jgi:hypothetical protein